MKKQKQRKKKHRKLSGATEAPARDDSHHLEETITTLARSTGASLKSHWRPVVGVVALVTAVVLGYVVSETLKEAGEDRLSDRLYELTASPEALEPEAELSPSEFRELVSEARGARVEKSVLKLTVQYLLDRAERASEESETPSEPEQSGPEEPAESDDPAAIGDEVLATFGETSEPAATAPETDARDPTRGEILELVESIVEEAKERFPRDDEMSRWALNVENRLAADEDRTWLPEEREYALQPPGDAPAQPGEPEGDGGPSAGRSPDGDPADSEPEAADPPEEDSSRKSAGPSGASER